ncbi:MAG: DNA internalization-related competence protein ComEC/Rec2 [Luteimonas sp.]
MDDSGDPQGRVAPFGLAAAAALLCGVAASLQLPVLPSVWALASAFFGGALLWICGRRLRLPGVLVCGLALAGLHASLSMALRLPAALEGQDLVVAGQVVDLPQVEPGRVAFRFRVDRNEAQTKALRGRLLQLSWYAPRKQRGDHAGVDAQFGRAQRTLLPGSRWRLPLRLRAPRGLRNPGTIDTEKRALAARIAATGYVRDPLAAQQLAPALGIDAWRWRMSARIANAVASPSSRFVRALALGDTRGLDDADWTTLRAAGLTHLIAISGFHVAMVAGFIALLVAGLWWLLPTLGKHVPRIHAAAIAALLGAAGYAAVAGFALPTVRTLLMIGLVALARLLRRAQRASDALALVAIAVLLVDPLSVVAPGFWLSFGGVAWLLWCLPGNGERGWRVQLRGFFSAQAVATIGLLPLTVMLFGQASLAGPLANMVAIPWWSLVVVPLALLGTALDAAWPGVGAWSWQLAAWAFDLAWPGFQWLGRSPLSLWWLPEPGWYAVPLALLASVWLLLPRGIPGKPLALLLWLPLLWPSLHLPRTGEFELVVLDVGQGLSVLVRTSSRNLLYDMGPAKPDGFDAGASAVVPALHALGVHRLDRAVVSHGDNDHAGGYPAVMQGFPAGLTWFPQGMRSPAAPGTQSQYRTQACRVGIGWRWDGVAFRFLHPPDYFPYFGNESSCVLRVQAANGASALVTGDIPDVIERALVWRDLASVRSEVVVVAHHGSKGSSDPDFVAATGARLALISAGYGNRFNHPNPLAVARWRNAGAQVATTLDTGAQRVHLGVGEIAFEAERERRPRLWDARRRSP